MAEFISTLARKPDFGDTFCYQAKIAGEEVNLNHNAENGGNILQISLKIKSKEIVVTAKVNGSPKTKTKKWPSLKLGMIFCVVVFVNAKDFYVYMNSEEIAVLAHEGKANLIQGVQFHSVSDVQCFHHRRILPSCWPPSQITTPFSNDIPTQFKTGQIVAITATASGNDKGNFILRFRDAITGFSRFHMNVSFKDKLVRRNSQNDSGKWFDKDETGGDFPFSFGKEFEIGIAMTRTRFLIAFNRKRFATLEHKETRDVLATLRGFELYGEDKLVVTVKKVQHCFVEALECLDYDIAKYSIIAPTRHTRRKCKERKVKAAIASLEEDSSLPSKEHRRSLRKGSSGDLFSKPRRSIREQSSGDLNLKHRHSKQKQMCKQE